jgi:rhodanese-related sulfurtransferase
MRPHATLASIDVEAAAAASTSGSALLLDVREYDEWMAGHAPTARHIPMSELPGRVAELAGDAQIVCVCRSGGRSAQVTEWLRRQGFDALNMTGGMSRWAAMGHPVVNHAGHAGTVI